MSVEDELRQRKADLGDMGYWYVEVAPSDEEVAERQANCPHHTIYANTVERVCGSCGKKWKVV